VKREGNVWVGGEERKDGFEHKKESGGEGGKEGGLEGGSKGVFFTTQNTGRSVEGEEMYNDSIEKESERGWRERKRYRDRERIAYAH